MSLPQDLPFLLLKPKRKMGRRGSAALPVHGMPLEHSEAAGFVYSAVRRQFHRPPRAVTLLRRKYDFVRFDRVVQARIDAALVRFAATGHGDLKSLNDRPGELRLRVDKWRGFFCLEPPDLIRDLGIDTRGEAH